MNREKAIFMTSMSKQQKIDLLVEKKSFINAIVYSFVYPLLHEMGNLYWDDMFQVSYIVYFEKCDTYCADKGATIDTYMTKVIKNNLTSKYRVLKKFYEDSSFDETTDIQVYNLNYVMEYQIKEAIVFIEGLKKHVCTTIQYGLTAIQWQLQDLDLRNYAKHIGKTTSYLSMCISRARKLLSDTDYFSE